MMVFIFLSLLLEPLLADHEYNKQLWDCTYNATTSTISVNYKSTSVVTSCTPVDCSKETAPTTSVSCTLIYHGGATGEPHFRMWIGDDRGDAWFDYQGACDLVLVDNPKLSTGHFLNIHIRTTIQGEFSYIENAAIQIDEEVLEIQARKLGSGKDIYLLNGADVSNPTLIAGFSIEKVNMTKYCAKQKCEGADIIKIDLEDDGVVVITNWKGYLYVDVIATGDGFLFSEGLMGKRDRSGKFARNGTLLHDADEFAQEWQVLNTERHLFKENRYPQSPIPCTPPPKQIQRRNDGMGLTRRQAADACSGLYGGVSDACVYDVMATSDLDMAIPYFLV